jgi:hypothetical protein
MQTGCYAARNFEEYRTPERRRAGACEHLPAEFGVGSAGPHGEGIVAHALGRDCALGDESGCGDWATRSKAAGKASQETVLILIPIHNRPVSIAQCVCAGLRNCRARQR